MTSIPVYIGDETDCDYLPGNLARMAYISPTVPLDRSLYSRLAEHGFRRSGDIVYRPHCRKCSACIPVRIPAESFKPNRTQRRVAKMNADLRVIGKPALFGEDHYRLYVRYLRSRHPNGPMAASSADDYLRFVASGWADTGFYEFRSGDELLAVAVVDHLAGALSAVYTFYDPDATRRSLGTFAVLWQIGEARRRGLAWVYLGFWIRGSRKMAYKDSFRPLQALLAQGWMTVDKGESAAP